MKKIVAIIFVAVLWPGLVLAVGVGVRPAALDANFVFGDKFETQVLVANVTSEPANYTIYAVDHKSNITLKPSDFVLSPGESKLVAIEIKRLLPGSWRTYLAVASRPMSAGSIDAVSGVKLPLSVKVYLSFGQWLFLDLVGIVCLIISIVILLKKKGKMYENHR